jgi:5-methylcytosine-specific restriction endonuclease McrA
MDYKEGTFREKLVKVHHTYWHKAWLRLNRKMSALKSSLKRRSKEAGVEFNIELNDIKKMFYDIYGKKCKYCNEVLNIRTIACDHIIPITKGGASTPDNLQLICKRCNTRKGPLNECDYETVVKWVRRQSDEVRTYLMKKLAKGGKY